MQLTRPTSAIDPRLFGKGRTRALPSAPAAGWTPSADLKLFATTFAAGFLVVSILIG